MSDRSLRSPLSGGGHGTHLGQAVARAEGLELVACADPDEAAARRASMAGTDVSLHDSVESILHSAEVDAVVIATPHHLLAPVALAAIRAGDSDQAEAAMLNHIDRSRDRSERARARSAAPPSPR